MRKRRREMLPPSKLDDKMTRWNGNKIMSFLQEVLTCLDTACSFLVNARFASLIQMWFKPVQCYLLIQSVSFCLMFAVTTTVCDIFIIKKMCGNTIQVFPLHFHVLSKSLVHSASSSTSFAGERHHCSRQENGSADGRNVSAGAWRKWKQTGPHPVCQRHRQGLGRGNKTG